MSMLKYRNEQPEPDKVNLKRYLSFRTSIRAVNIYIIALVFMSNRDFEQFDLKSFDDNLYEYGQPEYHAVEQFKIKGNIVKYWRKKQKRPLWLTRTVLSIIYKVYSKIR